MNFFSPSYTIGEVSSLLGVRSYTIRYWEREIQYLSPRKDSYGNRRFSLKELSLLYRLNYLISTNKYTIKGAKERLWQEMTSNDQNIRSQINIIRADLLAIRFRLMNYNRG